MENCPFCGSSNVKEKSTTTYGHGDCGSDVYVQCNDCKARGPLQSDYGMPRPEQFEKAISGWNIRKQHH